MLAATRATSVPIVAISAGTVATSAATGATSARTSATGELTAATSGVTAPMAGMERHERIVTTFATIASRSEPTRAIFEVTGAIGAQTAEI